MAESEVGKERMAKYDHDEQRRKIVQLLRDHKNAWQAGMQEATVDATQTHRSSGEHWNLTPKQIDEYFGATDEAKSHAELEKALARLRARCSPLVGPLDDVFFRSTAGDNDLERLFEKAAAGNAEARHRAILLQWCLDLLAVHLRGVDLKATFALRRTRLEEESFEKRNENIYRELLDLRRDYPRVKETEHVRDLADRYNVSERSIERIREAREGKRRVG